MKTKRSAQVFEIATLLVAGITYWLRIYPRTRAEIQRWKRRARMIPNRTLRDQAVHKLTGERLNPVGAAFFAVLGPPRYRARLIRLIVAFQIAYDYLDAINEQPDTASLRNGLWLHTALCDAVSLKASGGDYYRYHPYSDDGGYLADLVDECRSIVRTLPSMPELEGVLSGATERCGQAQSRNHAVQLEGQAQLVEWTREQSGGGGYLWWELAAGGISCLAIHALFAAAASDTSLAQAHKIDAAYFPPVCAISALLDSLIDYSDDARTENHSFTGYYETCAAAAERFAEITGEARMLLDGLSARGRHAVILASVASFYLSSEDANGEFARPVASGTLATLGPVTVPILAVLRLMRRRS